MRDLRRIGKFLLGAALSAGMAFGQLVSATIVGSVTDASGGVVTGAKVTLTEVETGVDRGAATNTSGNYTFVNLPPGKYRVTVEMPGFKKEVRGGIDLAVDQTARGRPA